MNKLLKPILMFFGIIVLLLVFPFAFTWYVITAAWETNIDVLEKIEKKLVNKHFKEY